MYVCVCVSVYVCVCARAQVLLQEVHARHTALLDAARPHAVAKRRRTRQRTARENITHLVDPGSFTEYASLLV